MGCGMRGKWENNGRKRCGELDCGGNEERDLLINIILIFDGQSGKESEEHLGGRRCLNNVRTYRCGSSP